MSSTEQTFEEATREILRYACKTVDYSSSRLCDDHEAMIADILTAHTKAQEQAVREALDMAIATAENVIDGMREDGEGDLRQAKSRIVTGIAAPIATPGATIALTKP